MVIDEHTLTLEELSTEVARLLSRYKLEEAQQDHRVSPVPDPRTIRYYTSLGLLDRPVIEGRQARYGKRHVLQLLAIKALQAAALPLNEIQSRIFGRSNGELEQLLAAIAVKNQQRAELQAARPIALREIIVEPGLRLQIESNWTPQSNIETTLSKIRAALEALSGGGNNGGDT